MKLRKIVRVERVYDAPEGWHNGKYATTYAPATGFHTEARLLPDGRLAVETSDRHSWVGPSYTVYESEQAYRDALNREPHRDPEGRGGRWFPSDYSRLKVREKHVPNEKAYRGYDRVNVCTCHQCGVEVDYHKAQYLAGGDYTPQYYPHCSDACVAKSLEG